MISLATDDIAILDIGLFIILLLTAFAIHHSRSTLKSIIYLGIFSLVTASLFLSMQAPDVAITEAAIGAAVSTLFLLVAAHKIGDVEASKRKSVYLSLAILLPLTVTMFSVVADMPTYGATNAPSNGSSASAYLNESYEQTHIPNVVTAVLGSYRGFDTLGEVYVVLAALLSVIAIAPLTPTKSGGKNA